MPLLPPYAVTVNARKQACVLDTSLAMSRYGLLVAQRLGEEFNLWLARELWKILDDSDYYRSHPKSLMLSDQKWTTIKSVEREKERLLAAMLTQWEDVRKEKDLAGFRLYWIGDSLSESLFPSETDQNLFFRYERLVSSLGRRVIKAEKKSKKALPYCCQDTLALTASLAPYKGFILTVQEEGNAGTEEREPAICSFLRKWGIKTDMVSDRQRVLKEQEYLNTILVRAGVSELLWAGLKLAVLHVVVPEALTIFPVHEDDAAPSQDLSSLEEWKSRKLRDWWKGASCFWYPVSM